MQMLSYNLFSGAGSASTQALNLRGTPDGIGRFPAEDVRGIRSGRSYSPDGDYSIPQASVYPVNTRFPATKIPGPDRESWLSGADSPPVNPETRISDSNGWPPIKGIRTKRVYRCNACHHFDARS